MDERPVGWNDAGEGQLAVMMKKHGGMLAGLCARLLSDRDLAQDAVQETFLKAYLKRESFRGENENSERAWLIRIAVNTCRDQQRSKWCRLVDGSVCVDALNLAAGHSSEEDILLRTVVESLPEKYRQVILMYYYRDMPVGEIAHAVKKSTTVVYRRLEEARALLGGMMAG